MSGITIEKVEGGFILNSWDDSRNNSIGGSSNRQVFTSLNNTIKETKRFLTDDDGVDSAAVLLNESK